MKSGLIIFSVSPVLDHDVQFLPPVYSYSEFLNSYNYIAMYQLRTGMPTRSALVSIVALVFVTWILISSINTVQIPTQGSTGNNGSTKNTGPTGNPNGTGTSGPGTNFTVTRNPWLGSFSFPNVTWPSLHLNLSFLNIIYKIGMLVLHYLQPVFYVLFLLMDLIGYAVGYIVDLILILLNPVLHFGKFNLNNTRIIPKTVTRTSTGGPSGTAGSTTMDIPPVITYIIIGVAIVLVAITGMGSLSGRKKKRGSAEQKLPDEGITLMKPSNSASSHPFIPYNIVSAPFAGWSRGNDLIIPEIPDDLPLVYPADMPLSVHMRTGGILKGEYTLVEQDGDQNYNIKLPEGCTETSARSGFESEKKIFRGVNTRNEISLLMRINLAFAFPEDISEAEHKTVREILYSEKMKALISDDRKLSETIRSYEKAYYGLKETDWSQFRDYLYCIRDTFTDARIAKCGS